VLDPFTLAGLCAAALVAGTVDAIAGGGGLITVPSLLLAGLPTHTMLGTNKGQSTFGSLSALVNFWRAGALEVRRVPVSFVCGFVGALLGARLVLLVPRDAVRPVVMTLLVCVAAVLAFRPDLATDRPESPTHEEKRGRAALIAMSVGAYDGFFGPGTGTFLIMAYVTLMGDAMTRASANAKVVNFASNLASLMVFAYHGVVRWDVALPMAAAQFMGGALGARLTLRRGGRFVRVVVLCVVVALVARLGWDLVHTH
jgi:hypothetical protein